MANILTVGEPMALFIAQETGDLKDVSEYHRYVAGAELNVVIGLTRLGHQVEYVTQLGVDPFGEYINEYLDKESILSTYVQKTDQYLTGFMLKSKNSEEDPEIYYYRENSAASQIDPSIIDKISFDDVDMLHITGIFSAASEKTFKFIKTIAQRAQEAGVTVTFDPNLRPQLWETETMMVERLNELAGVSDYILPGLGEAYILTGLRDEDQIAQFYFDLGVKGVVIKKGPESSVFITPETKTEVPGFKVDVVDTVGAGDGFAVGVISGLIDNLEPREILTRANAIGALQVSHHSDNENLPMPDELEEFIENASQRNIN